MCCLQVKPQSRQPNAMQGHGKSWSAPDVYHQARIDQHLNRLISRTFRCGIMGSEDHSRRIIELDIEIRNRLEAHRFLVKHSMTDTFFALLFVCKLLHRKPVTTCVHWRKQAETTIDYEGYDAESSRPRRRPSRLSRKSFETVQRRFLERKYHVWNSFSTVGDFVVTPPTRLVRRHGWTAGKTSSELDGNRDIWADNHAKSRRLL